MKQFLINTISQENDVYPITFYTACDYHRQETISYRRMPFHQILLILEGSGIVSCNGKSYILRKGSAFFTAKDAYVEYINKGGLVSAFLTVRGSAADSLAESLSDNGFLFFESVDCEKYVSRITRLIDDYCTECDEGALSVQAYSFFVDFLSQRKSDASAWLNETVKYINLNFDRKLTLAELANRAYVSCSKLCHEFKNYYSITVFEYLMNVRLRYARDLLQYSARIMTKDVAAQCGFSDVGYFCKAYKKKYGKTPSEEKRRLCGKKLPQSPKKKG